MKIGGERVHPPQLGAVGGDVELHFPESLGSVFHRLRQGRFCFGLRDVCAVEPREPPRRRCLERLDLIECSASRQQIGLRDARAIEMRQIAWRLGPHVEVEIEDVRSPFGGLGLERKAGMTAATDTVSRNERLVIIWSPLRRT